MGIKKVATDIGHGIKDVFTHPVQECEDLEHTLHDILTDEPAVKAEVITILKDVETATTELGTAIATKDPALLLASLPTLEKLTTDFKAGLPVFEAAYKALRTDLEQDAQAVTP